MDLTNAPDADKDDLDGTGKQIIGYAIAAGLVTFAFRAGDRFVARPLASGLSKLVNTVRNLDEQSSDDSPEDMWDSI